MFPQDNYKIKVQSLEYLPVRVVVTKDGVLFDPTADPVEIALPVINVDPTVWKAADWRTVGTNYFARVLVGPTGDFVLTRGDYDILVRITDDPEIPVLRAGRLSVI